MHWGEIKYCHVNIHCAFGRHPNLMITNLWCKKLRTKLGSLNELCTIITSLGITQYHVHTIFKKSVLKCFESIVYFCLGIFSKYEIPVTDKTRQNSGGSLQWSRVQRESGENSQYPECFEYQSRLCSAGDCELISFLPLFFCGNHTSLIHSKLPHTWITFS